MILSTSSLTSTCDFLAFNSLIYYYKKWFL